MHSLYHQIACGKMIVSDELAEMLEETGYLKKNCSKIDMKGLTEHVKTYSWDLN